MKIERDLFCEIAMERAGKKKILIIDDDVQMLKIYRFYLQDEYDVSLINNGKAAIYIIEEAEYMPDVVLLDYLMPEYNGAMVFKNMKKEEKTKDIPVIFLTGVTDDETIRECISYQPADYIVKPIAKSALLAKLDAYFKLNS